MADLSTSRGDISLADEFLADDMSGAPVPPVLDAVQFAGFGLQNENIVISSVTYSAPQREVGERSFARANGVYVETDFWRRTIITLRGYVTAPNQVELETLMDAMRRRLAVPAGLLMLVWAGQKRFWNGYARLESMYDQRRGSYVTYCPFEIPIVCINPFGRSESRDSDVPPTPATAALTTYEIENLGTAPTRTIWSFTLSTAGTCDGFTLTNTTTGEAIEVADSFSDGDVVVIDGEAQTVKVNGTVHDYTGVFPSAAAGTNSFTLEPEGSGFSIDVTELHYRMYY